MRFLLHSLLLEPKRLVKDSMWKTACDKVVCERWYVTKRVWRGWCEAGGGRMVCDRDARERIVNKDCIQDGVWQHIETDGVWQRRYVTDGVWQRCVWDGLWNQGGCHIGVMQPKRAAQCHKCHACHAKRRWMWDCATSATWNARRCHQVPRLPRKVPRRPGRLKPAQARHPVPQVPRLPRKTKVDVRLCDTCYATPATQKCRGVPGD